MRVAVICFAYLGSPSGVSLLAEYFDGMEVDLYLHVDGKVDIRPYAELPTAWRNVTILVQRQPIFWAGFGLVRATVAAVEFAIATGNHYDRFFTLTEDTLPLRSRTEFWARMAGDEEFLHARVEPRMRERYEAFYYPDSPATSILGGLDMEFRRFSPSHVDDLKRLTALHARGKAPVPRLFHGSGWWGLSAQHVERFLASYRDDPWLRESFEFSLVPEEQYPHTVLGELPNSSNAVFVDFSRDPRPYLYRTVDEIIAARTGTHLFARKVPIGDPAIREFVRFIA